MKILVTGGAGFLGSNLVRELLKQDHQVWVVDNLVTGRKSNLESLLDNENLTVIEADVCDLAWQRDLAADLKFDQIYHLASPASPPKYQQYPEITLRVNTVGTQNLLELAAKHQAVILFASTSEVYGDPAVHPQPESYWGNVNSFGERSCYDEAKRCGEAWCYVYAQKGVKVKVVRIFNTYGPLMDPEDGRVISNLVTQALQQQPLTIYGDGSQTRSYCFVSDLVAGLMAYMDSSVMGEVINLGNDQEQTVLETAELIKKLTGSSSQIVFQDLPSDDPQLRRPDLKKAQQLLGWSAQVDLATGLKQTIEYFQSVLK